MAKLPFLFFLLFLQTLIQISLCHNHKTKFFKNCKTSRCNVNGPEIRFPLRLDSSPQFCGVPGMTLTCSPNNDTLLTLTNLGSLKVQNVDYHYGIITVELGDSWPSCLLQNITLLDMLSTQIYWPMIPPSVSLVTCEKSFVPKTDFDLAGPIPCLRSRGSYVYVVAASESMDVLPLDCTVWKKDIDIFRRTYERKSDQPITTFKLFADNFLERRLVTLEWFNTKVTSRCRKCQQRGRQCGSDEAKNGAFCKPHDLNIKLISATCATAFVLILTIAAVLIYLSKKSDKEKETRLKVERFLATYRITKPTRYTFTQLKKITKQFRDKLGQGGFGSVYKGELPNGLPVAVKMLERTKGAGEEFINEVATIGRIHHVNIVRLLGFCSEGMRHALVYEFMPNESLEKYITRNNNIHLPLRKEKMLQIAIGIARGIEYLHQGCNERILHFDIKPHNVLLDEDLNPKIADFGLAKLYAKDQSIVTMTAARGTMGYIAPEVYSRNFGTVSYKSDVYSFGMLLLEMVGGRKSVDPEFENQSENYFPELLYNQLVDSQELQLEEDIMTPSDSEIAKKLIIVAFWCVQWNPVDRPSMTRVVHMLIGNLQNLEMPPKPFISSLERENSFVICEV
ncbi:hypothetical protein LUZ60_012774 [Juncus effusus]|nr:hypothetical protein LUZ60_012774 [Juncus effusus]